MAREITEPLNQELEQPRDEWEELFGSEKNFEFWLNQALKEMKPEGPTQ